MILTPRPYQLEGRDFLAGKTRALLADQMRVGKTPQAILAADKIGARRIVTVCPAIACEHWVREWAKWSPAREPARILVGAAPVYADNLVASYDMARRMLPMLRGRRNDLLVIDECHFAKNPEAERTKMVYGKEGLGWHSNSIWSLSGTPAPKHAAELWAMMRAFGVVGLSYDAFVSRYCDVRPVPYKIMGTKVAMIPELKALLAKFMLRRTRREVAPDMPEIDFQFLETRPARAVLEQRVPTGLSDTEMLSWLEMRAGSLASFRRECAQVKVPALVENIHFALENQLLDRTVVFGYHVDPIEEVAARLNAHGHRAATITGKTSQGERTRIQDAFRAGELDVVAANIQAAGTAIDLSAARHSYFLELSWVPGDNAQAASRLVSMDKQDPVTSDVCTWPGSADDQVQQVLLRRSRELAQLY